MWLWADKGVTWLNEQFKGKGLDFTTSVDVEKREVLFRVYRRVKSDKVHETNVGHMEVIFETIEPVQHFVSHLTVTKIILLAG